jgi:hypothetical protein
MFREKDNRLESESFAEKVCHGQHRKNPRVEKRGKNLGEKVRKFKLKTEKTTEFRNDLTQLST